MAGGKHGGAVEVALLEEDGCVCAGYIFVHLLDQAEGAQRRVRCKVECQATGK